MTTGVVVTQEASLPDVWFEVVLISECTNDEKRINPCADG
jgi:hypothetical protein